jgi:hypothetical protein
MVMNKGKGQEKGGKEWEEREGRESGSRGGEYTIRDRERGLERWAKDGGQLENRGGTMIGEGRCKKRRRKGGTKRG